MEAFSHIAFAAKSDIGRRRKNNEDSFGAFPSLGIWCVADGMGGGDDGEVASAATVGAVEKFVKANPPPPNAAFPASAVAEGVRSAVNGASKWIYERAKSRNLKGCGSTFVCLCLDPSRPGEAVALHAGDSRLYRIRGRGIQQITKDHSAAELIGAKDESEVNPMFRGMILRAVGIQPSVQIDATPLPLKEGDFILICSDGLSRMVSDKRIAAIIREKETPDAAVDALIAAANEAGGIDNVTVILVKVGALPPPLPTVDTPLAAGTSGAPADAATGGASESGDADSETSVSFESATDEGDADTAVSFATVTPTSATAASTSATASGEIVRKPDDSLAGTAWKAMQEIPAGENAERRKTNRRKIAVAAAVAIAAILVAVVVMLADKGPEKPEIPDVSDSPETQTAEAETAANTAAIIAEEEEKRVAAENARKAAEEEAKRIAAEAEAKRLEAERKAEEARKEMAAKMAEMQRQLKKAEEKAAKEKAEREALEKAEAERKAREEAERKEREEAERIAREKAEKAEAERKKREEAERIAREKAEAERKAEAAKIAAERKAAEDAAKKAEEERIARENAAKAEAERKAEAQRKAEEEKRKAEIRERALPHLDAAWEYCDVGEALEALKELKAANDLGYVLTKEEKDRIWAAYNEKDSKLGQLIRNKKMASSQERKIFEFEQEEMGRLMRDLKSEK